MQLFKDVANNCLDTFIKVIFLLVALCVMSMFLRGNKLIYNCDQMSKTINLLEVFSFSHYTR